MADDLIQKYGEDNPSEKSLAEAELLAGLQGHFVPHTAPYGSDQVNLLEWR